MVSVASGGTADRITARTLFKVLRAGSETPARYSSMFLGIEFAFFIWLIPPLRLHSMRPERERSHHRRERMNQSFIAPATLHPSRPTDSWCSAPGGRRP